MRFLKAYTLIALLIFPAAGWCSDLYYALEVEVDTVKQKITGKALITSNGIRYLRLSLSNLSELKVDGNTLSSDGNNEAVLTLLDESSLEGQVSLLSHSVRASLPLSCPFLQKSRKRTTTVWEGAISLSLCGAARGLQGLRPK